MVKDRVERHGGHEFYRALEDGADYVVLDNRLLSVNGCFFNREKDGITEGDWLRWQVTDINRQPYANRLQQAEAKAFDYFIENGAVIVLDR